MQWCLGDGYGNMITMFVICVQPYGLMMVCKVDSWLAEFGHNFTHYHTTQPTIVTHQPKTSARTSMLSRPGQPGCVLESTNAVCGVLAPSLLS